VSRVGKGNRKQAESSAPKAAAPAPQTGAAASAGSADTAAADPISFSNLTLHELFEQQARDMLDRADIDEEQKQSILVAMACPCCGAGGMSFSVKLKR